MLAAVLLLMAAAESAAPEMAPDTREAAELAGVLPLLERVTGPDADEARREIDRRVLRLAFECDQVVAALDVERYDVQELREWAEARENRLVSRLNLAVGILAGGAAVGTGLTIW